MVFIARDDLPAVAQAAIAHAQFETIHPFIDGNGRVGRALLHVVLRRRGVASRFVPPVSIVLAAQPAAYVDGLTAFREGRLADWVGSFASAAARAATVSIELADRVAELQAEWRERAGRPREGSAAARLIALLPALPVLSARSTSSIESGRASVVADAVRRRSCPRRRRRVAEVAGFELFAYSNPDEPCADPCAVRGDRSSSISLTAYEREVIRQCRLRAVSWDAAASAYERSRDTSRKPSRR